MMRNLTAKVLNLAVATTAKRPSNIAKSGSTWPVPT